MESQLQHLLFYFIIYSLGVTTGIITFQSISITRSWVPVTAPINWCLKECLLETAGNTTQNQQKIRVQLPLCKKGGVNLLGQKAIDQSPVDIKQLEEKYGEKYGGSVMQGGWYNPLDCRYRRKVAIILPFRQRSEQLNMFLRHMHPMLQRQRLYYRIFVVEQLENDPFNRAGLLNVGYVQANKIADFDCFVFTDVDMLPEDDRNFYGCPTSPRHMSVAIDKFHYQLPYSNYFGGCGSFNKSHFEKINGFSNLYFGWGGEDDDLEISLRNPTFPHKAIPNKTVFDENAKLFKSLRVRNRGLNLTRPSLSIGRYSMTKINHFQSSKVSDERFNLVKTANQRIEKDGLNSLKYNLIAIVEDPLLTYIKVVIKKSMYGR